jgi:GTP-binding protein
MGLFSSARFFTTVNHLRDLPPDSGREVAFVGRSNAGKSSAINTLARHTRLAFTSKTPGRTQQLNFFLVDDRLTFVDLPGYGFARVPADVQTRWKSLVEGYLGRRRALRAVVVIIDLRRGLQPDDRQLCEYLQACKVPVILVATKADKLAYAARRRQAQAMATEAVPGAVACVVCSGRTGEGMLQLWKLIETLAFAGEN